MGVDGEGGGGPPRRRGGAGKGGGSGKRGGGGRRGGSPQGRRGPTDRKPGRQRDRGPGSRTAHRPIEWPFAEGPVPPEFLEAVQDVVLFSEKFGLGLPGGAEARLARFAQRLAEGNQVMNLTRVATPEGIASRHLVDSLIFTACLEGKKKARVLDLGTGPGLPAIPLAIAREGWKITALDSTAKKMAFVREVAAELELGNLLPVVARAEELASDPDHRGKYDAVVARAVASLPELLELTLPFLRRNGFLFAAKGSRAEEEVERSSLALRLLRAEVLAIETYPTLDPEVEYRMVVVQKLGPTPKRYPRHPSVRKKQPLAVVEV